MRSTWENSGWRGRVLCKRSRREYVLWHRTARWRRFSQIITAGRDIVRLDLQIPATMAVREQRQIVIDEIETSDTDSAWRRAALDRGFHSCAALPLISGNKVAGVGVLFSKEPHFFDAEHLRLLSDLAADQRLRSNAWRNRIWSSICHSTIR